MPCRVERRCYAKVSPCKCPFVMSIGRESRLASFIASSLNASIFTPSSSTKRFWLCASCKKASLLTYFACFARFLLSNS
jgi:hypothetical protein